MSSTPKRGSHRLHPLIAGTLGAILITVQPLAAAFSVSAESSLRIFAGADGADVRDNQNTGNLEALAVSLVPVDVTSTGSSAQTTAAIRGTAALGNLRLFGSYTAESFGTSGDGAGADLSATLRWHDVAHITHPDLEDGTLVDFVARFELTGALTSFRDGNALPQGLMRAAAVGGNVFGDFNFVVEETLASPAPTFVFEEVFSARVGDRIPLDGLLHFDIGGDAIFGGMSTVTANFATTAVFTLVPVTPDAGYVTDSGLRYVPLPPAMLLLTAPLLALFGSGGRGAPAPQRSAHR